MARNPHQVIVEVIEARSLPGEDATGMSDLMVELELGPSAHRRKWTEVKPQSVSAVWKQSFFFHDIMLSEGEFLREKVVFRVYNRNDFRANDVLGSSEISLNFVRRRDGHTLCRHWLALYDAKSPSAEKGFLLVTLSVILPDDPPFRPEMLLSSSERIPQSEDAEESSENIILQDPAMELRQAYFLNVLIYRAEELDSSLSISRACNPFVSVRFNGNVLQTQVKFNQKNPSFNRLMQFPFYLPLMSDSIEIQLWNRIPFRPDQLLGSILHLQSDLTHKPRGPLWENLEVSSRQGPGKVYAGRVILRLSVRPSRIPKPILKSSALDSICDEPPREPYSLKVFIVRASEVNVFGGYLSVDVCWGNRVLSTSKCLGSSGNFYWNQSLPSCIMSCPSDLEQVPSIILVLWHHVGVMKSRIGAMQMSAKELTFQSACYGVNADFDESQSKFNEQVQMNSNIRLTGQDRRSVNKYLCERPKWRSFDGQNGPIGHILSSIVFSKGEKLPAGVPAEIPTQHPISLNFQIYVSHGLNFPAVAESGLTNSFLEFRCMGRTFRSEVVDGTLFPIFNVVLEPLMVQFDEKEDPSLHVLLFHRIDSRNSVLIARSSSIPVRFQKVAPMLQKIELYPLRNFSVFSNEEAPSVFLSMLLTSPEDTNKFPFKGLGRGEWVKYQLKLLSIGLRNVLPTRMWVVERPSIEISFPEFSPVVNEQSSEEPYRVKRTIILEKQPRRSVTQELANIDDMRLADDDVFFTASDHFPGSFQITAQIFDTSVSGDIFVGVVYISLKDLLQNVLSSAVPISISNYQNDDNAENENPLLNNDLKALNLDIELANFETYPQITVAGTLKASGSSDAVENNRGDDLQARQKSQRVDVSRCFSVKRASSVSVFDWMNQRKGVYSSDLKTVGTLKLVVFAIPVQEESSGIVAYTRLDEFSSSIQRVLDEYFVIRLYVYCGWNIPIREGLPYLGMKSRSRPYLVLKFGTNPLDCISDRDSNDIDEFSPTFNRMFTFEGNFPYHARLEIAVWDKMEMGADKFIGSSVLDLEQRVFDSLSKREISPTMKQQTVALSNPTTLLPQGSLDLRVDVLNWEQSQRIQPEIIALQAPEMYELRVIIWSTRGICFHDDIRSSDSITQVLSIVSNFSGKFKGDVEKITDTAYNAGEDAAWNYRVIFPVQLPAQVPRVKITVWQDSLVWNREAIGDVQINLASFFNQTFRERKPKHRLERRWYDIKHPGVKDKSIGSVNVEFYLVSSEEAERRPVGEAQNEPNRDPFLPRPDRNPPPWAIGSKFLNFLEDLSKKKLLIALMILLLVACAVGIWLVITVFGSRVV